MKFLSKTSIPNFEIYKAESGDESTILSFINSLAKYEKLSHEVVATDEDLKEHLFGPNKVAEVIMGKSGDTVVGFALFFHNFSTFLGRPGIYLEDLFVLEEQRGKGFGKSILTYLAKLAVERNCGRLEWSVLDWNEPAIDFYKSLGAKTMDGWLINRVSGESLLGMAEKFEL